MPFGYPADKTALMRADICEPANDEAVEQFRCTLRRLGAELSEKRWALGVDIYRLMIGSQELTIFSDAWSIDIEGPESLVERVLREFKQSGS